MASIPASWRREFNRYSHWREPYHRYTRIRRFRQSISNRVHESILSKSQSKNRMYNPVIPIIVLASGFLTSIAVIVWSIRQPELREGWRAVFKRIKEAREAQYDPDDITAFFREYWIIIGEMADTNCLDRLTNLTLDMEIFQRKFRGKVPDALFDSKVLSLIQRYDLERKRVMYMPVPKKN